MSVKDNLISFLSGIPSEIKLVAVSKTKPISDIKDAYDAGQRIFGENKVQDMVAKQPHLPDDIQWHFIGHLQTNKVKFIAPFVDHVHGVDSLKLLNEINKHALKNNRKINCLLQFHIADEQTKFGLDYSEAVKLLEESDFANLKGVKIAGVMGMATYTDNDEQIRSEFKNLKKYYDKLKNSFFANNTCFKEISMGMSGDYKIAIEEGSTMIRIGTILFGERNYSYQTS